MELNRYDRLVWRFNGALIAIGGLLAIILISIACYKLFQEIFQERRVNAVVNINEQTKQNEYLLLKRFSRIKGTSWLVAGLDAEQNYQQAYYSKSASSTRNYLFFDLLNRSAHWLLRNNSSLILTVHDIYENVEVERDLRKVNAFIYETVSIDSNGDSRLNSEDKKSLIFYRLSAKARFDLLDGTDEFIGVEQVSANEALIFFRDSQKNYVASLELNTGKINEKKELSPTSMQ